MATTTKHIRTEARQPKRATPWGRRRWSRRSRVPQRAGEQALRVVVELLESARGEPLVRIAYTTDGVARRGPVTLRARDLERLRAAVAGAAGARGGSRADGGGA